MSEQDLLKQLPNVDRLEIDINTLASYTEPGNPWTRRPFTKLFQDGRDWLSREMKAAGLTVELDASGNLIGRQPGTENLPPILIGRFDGAIGVIAGLEIARCLEELGIELRHPLEIVDFLSEEPSDYAVSTIGSRGMSNNLTPEMLEKTNDAGQTLREGLIELGGRPDDISTEARKQGDIAAYLEMHIEQGPVLEQSGIPLAAVTGIAGIRRFSVVVSGEVNHAGTTPMALRKDGLIAAAYLIVDAEKIICQEKNAVGTVGYISVSPNMANVVPGPVELIAEVRSIDPATIERIGENLKRRAAEIADERQTPISMELLTDAHPVQADPRLIEITTQACLETAPGALALPSGAGHDATQIATIAPIGMVFVPSRGGKSHSPNEWTDLKDIALGVQAMARALLKADRIF
jgi:N-carbamoyl-L-amino-acid hydrolase